MNFINVLWNIKKLKRTLDKGPLPQQILFRCCLFFICYSSFTNLISEKILWLQDLPRIIPVLIFFISGLFELIASYKFNKGRGGHDFLGRYLSIKLCTSIRLFVFVFLVFYPIILFLVVTNGFANLDWQQSFNNPEIIEKAFDVDIYLESNPEIKLFLEYISLILWRIIIPLRVVLHMKDLNHK